MHKALCWLKEYFADYGILIGILQMFFGSIFLLLILPFCIVYAAFSILNDLIKEFVTITTERAIRLAKRWSQGKVAQLETKKQRNIMHCFLSFFCKKNK